MCVVIKDVLLLFSEFQELSWHCRYGALCLLKHSRTDFHGFKVGKVITGQNKLSDSFSVYFCVDVGEVYLRKPWDLLPEFLCSGTSVYTNHVTCLALTETEGERK